MVNEALNVIVMLLFGVLLGTLDTAMTLTGEAHGLGSERNLLPRRSGENWWTWQRRIAFRQSEQTSSVVGRYPVIRFLMLSIVAVGILMFLVVRYSPLGFRWLPFLGGIFAGGWLMKVVFDRAKSGRLKVSQVGLLDRLVQGDRRLSRSPDPPTTD